MDGVFGYLVDGVLIVLVFSIVYNAGRLWMVSPPVLRDAWHFSRRIGVLSFSMVASFATYHLWMGEVLYPSIENIWKIFAALSAGSWAYFLFLEWQSVKWETLLRQVLAVQTWDSRTADLSEEDTQKVMSFLMANDDILRAILSCVGEDHKSFTSKCHLEYNRRTR